MFVGTKTFTSSGGANIMAYKMPNFQLKLNENGKLSPVGGAILIPTIFEKLGLQKMFDENIAASKESGVIKYTDSSYIQIKTRS